MNKGMRLWLILGIVSLFAALLASYVAQETNSMTAVVLSFIYIGCMFFCVMEYFSAFGRFVFRGDYRG